MTVTLLAEARRRLPRRSRRRRTLHTGRPLTRSQLEAERARFDLERKISQMERSTKP